MKRGIRVLALLLAVVMACGLLPQFTLPAEAATTYYELIINGTQVTSKNKDDVLGDGIFRYIPERKELDVRRSFASNGQPVINNGIKGLHVWLRGNIQAKNTENVIYSTTDITISTISGSGASIRGGDSTDCIGIEGNAVVTIEDALLEMKGRIGISCPYDPYHPETSKKSKVVIRRSSVYAKCDWYCIGQFFGGLKLEDCEITKPAAYEFSYGLLQDENGDEEIKEFEIISTAKYYDVNVEGKCVCDKNCSDVLEDGGSVKYDPQTKTLTLKNPKLTGRAGWVIDSYEDGLTIRGSAVMKTNSEEAVMMLDDTIINGDFTIQNTAGNAIEAYENLRFAGGTIKLQAEQTALSGPEKEYKISFTGGSVTMAGKDYAIYSRAPIELSGGAKVELPKKGKIIHFTDDADFWYVGKSDGSVAASAKIAVPNPFEDVKAGTDYYNAVLWAAYHKPYQVTAGIDKTHFGPTKTVTRAQAMTFFWAALNRPKFKKANTQFVDVKKTDWFYKSVMWAVENGVTAGTDATHFSPNKTCNRGEILAFLYASLKKPKVKIKNPYKDVSNQWYKKAALWAYANGIERGEKGKFNASTPCTRASTVTYLYRFLEKQDLDLD